MRKSELVGQLERVSAERDHYRQELESTGPYLGLAKELQERVVSRLSQAGQDDLDRVFADTIASREDELVRTGIEAKIDALPVERVLGMYATLLGDDSVNEPLRIIAGVKLRETERQARITEIRQEAEISRQLDLSKVEEGEIIEFGLVRDDRIELSSRMSTIGSKRKFNGRTIAGRVRDSESTTLQLISDDVNAERFPLDLSFRYMSSRKHDNTTMSDHRLFKIGTMVRSGNVDDFEPVVTAGTSITIDEIGNGGSSVIASYKLGYVSIGEDILLTV